MLNLWRKAQTGQKKGSLPPLPSGYTAVNAIRRISTFGQIAIGISIDKVRKIEASMKRLSSYTTNPIIRAALGECTTSDTDSSTSSTEQSPNVAWNSSTVSVSIPYADLLSDDYQSITITLPAQSSDTYTWTSLFNWRTQQVWTDLIGFQWIKIYDSNDNLVAQLQPCIEDATQYVGYYDIVNNRFMHTTYVNIEQWGVDE